MRRSSLGKMSVSLGALFGIDIRVNWSWAIVLLLVVINLGRSFRQMHPGWSAFLVWATGFIAALLFFLSVLAHELAHSVVARSRGVPVRDITLHLFGGVSDLQREPESPAAEFLLAIVGPLVSLILGALLILVTWLSLLPAGFTTTNPTAAVAQLTPAQTLLAWLGAINVTLAIFNMLPGLPLDGGRVFRSLVWAVTGNLRLATRLAAGLARTLAWLMIFAGAAMAFGARIPFFGTGLGSGLWLGFIGWFLHSASAQSYQQVAIRDALHGVSVSQVMCPDPPTCHPSLSLTRLFNEHMLPSGVEALLVVDRGELLGLISLADVRRVPRDAWGVTTVRETMTPAERLITVKPDDEVVQALNTLATSEVRQVPVLQNGEIAGLLRQRDIAQWLQQGSRTPPRQRQTLDRPREPDR